MKTTHHILFCTKTNPLVIIWYLITNPNAYFIFPTLNEIMHIPFDGYLYEVDTTILHSFVNCGPDDRTHLVISKRS